MNGITIYITAYKAKDFLKECLDSISNQTYFINNPNYEILLGIDGCEETLEFAKTIMEKYNNLRILMMNKNCGTYITSNTLIKEAKYDNLIRFDSDDIMLPYMVETIMNNKNSSDVFRFKLQNFGLNNLVFLSEGPTFHNKQFMLKYGGFQPWRCSSDSEFKKRVKNYGIHGETKEILFLRRCHSESLTKKKGETCNTPLSKGSYRQEKTNYVINMVVHNENEAKIKMVTSDFTEICNNGILFELDLTKDKIYADFLNKYKNIIVQKGILSSLYGKSEIFDYEKNTKIKTMPHPYYNDFHIETKKKPSISKTVNKTVVSRPVNNNGKRMRADSSMLMAFLTNN